MRIKTIIVILIMSALAALLIQNTGTIGFKFLWANINASKVVLFASIAFMAFVLGVIVGRPKKTAYYNVADIEDDLESERPGTLSDEDREYIN